MPVESGDGGDGGADLVGVMRGEFDSVAGLKVC